MADIVYRQMHAPRELPQPPGNSKAPGWGQVLSANPRGCARGVGGLLWIKLIPAPGREGSFGPDLFSPFKRNVDYSSSFYIYLWH